MTSKLEKAKKTIPEEESSDDDKSSSGSDGSSGSSDSKTSKTTTEKKKSSETSESNTEPSVKPKKKVVAKESAKTEMKQKPLIKQEAVSATKEKGKELTPIDTKASPKNDSSSGPPSENQDVTAKARRQSKIVESPTKFGADSGSPIPRRRGKQLLESPGLTKVSQTSNILTLIYIGNAKAACMG